MKETNWKNVYQTSRIFRVLRNVSLVCFFASYLQTSKLLRRFVWGFYVKRRQHRSKDKLAGPSPRLMGCRIRFECLRWDRLRDSSGAIFTTAWFMKDRWPVMEMGERQHFCSFRGLTFHEFSGIWSLKENDSFTKKTSFQTSMVFIYVF